MPEFTDYEKHLAEGGAPFGGKHNANIREAVEGYQAVVAHYRAALREAHRQLSLHDFKGPKQVRRAMLTIERALDETDVYRTASGRVLTEADFETLANEAERGYNVSHLVPCDAVLYHGPGHQSSSRCELHGPHDVHETHYDDGQRARWRDGQFKPGEPHGITGFFDEPPED